MNCKKCKPESSDCVGKHYCIRQDLIVRLSKAKGIPLHHAANALLVFGHIRIEHERCAVDAGRKHEHLRL